MKHLFLVLLCTLNFDLSAQYFSNVYYTETPVDSSTDIQHYDGLKTTYNYYPTPSDWYQVGLGTFRNRRALLHQGAPMTSGDVWTNKVTFHRTSDTGIINQNYMYRFIDTLRTDSLLDAEGRSIDEIAGEEGQAGYVFCGMVGPFKTDSMAPYMHKDSPTCKPVTNALYGIIDYNGDVVWANQLDMNGGGDIATCIRRSNVDSTVYIMCGYSQYAPVQNQPDKHIEESWVARLRRSGNTLVLLWAARYQHQVDEKVVNSRAYSLVDMPDDGNIYVCGRINEDYDANLGYSGVITAIDTFGFPYWIKRYHYGPNEGFKSIIRDSVSNLFVVGYIEDNPTVSDPVRLNYWAVSVDTSGMLNWSRELVVRDPISDDLRNSEGFDVVRNVNLAQEVIFYISGYAQHSEFKNHVYKIRSDGTAMLHWDDQPNKIVETNTFDYNGSGIDIIKNDEAVPGVLLFSNIRNTNKAGNDLNAECNGYHTQVYYNGRSCSTTIYDPESYDPSINLTAIAVLGNWEGNPTYLATEKYDLKDSSFCWQHIVAGGSNSRSNNRLVNEHPFIVNLDSYSDSEVRLYIENGNESQLKFEILNIEGIIVQTVQKKIQTNQRIVFSISNLAAGIYFVRISNNDQSEIIKFVKAN